jgi:hypothetical protein
MYFTAKYIQIPASLSMLVCTNTNGLEIFPPDTYLLYDINKLDLLYSNILEHNKYIDLTISKIKKLNSYVLQNHNHDIRSQEFIRVIK